MTISYPLTFPAVTGLSRVRLRQRDVVADQPSLFTGQNEIQVFPGQWWEGEFFLRPLVSRDRAMPWITFVKKLKGKTGTFLFGDPLGATPLGVATGTPLVKGGSQSGNQLVTDGWTPSVTGILKAGDYIQHGTGNDARLYMNLTDADSDSGGNATLDLWPDIRGDKVPADNDPLVISNAKGVFRLSINDNEWDISAPAFYDGITVPFREAI